MAKRKITPFSPWETLNADGKEKRYIRIANTQLVSPVMRSLSNSAFRIYTNMRMESGGNISFTFPYSKYKSYMTRPTFEKVVDELVNTGFIEVVQRNANLRKANVYRFSEGWKNYVPP